MASVPPSQHNTSLPYSPSCRYDILRDDEAREDYDYMLDHPEQFYQNVYRAWRRRMAPHVDVRIVLAVTISLISLIQYYNGWTK